MLEAKYPFPITCLLFGTAVTNVSEAEISWNVDSLSHDLIIYLKIGKMEANHLVQLMHF